MLDQFFNDPATVERVRSRLRAKDSFTTACHFPWMWAGLWLSTSVGTGPLESSLVDIVPTITCWLSWKLSDYADTESSTGATRMNLG